MPKTDVPKFMLVHAEQPEQDQRVYTRLRELFKLAGGRLLIRVVNGDSIFVPKPYTNYNGGKNVLKRYEVDARRIGAASCILISTDLPESWRHAVAAGAHNLGQRALQLNTVNDEQLDPGLDSAIGIHQLQTVEAVRAFIGNAMVSQVDAVGPQISIDEQRC